MSEQPSEDLPQPRAAPRSQRPLSRSEVEYNVVTDTLGGPNLRWRDNLYQGLFVLGCAILFGLIGTFTVGSWAGADVPRYFGGLLGALVGLILGTFLSGLFLMIYRLVRHARGRHD